MIQSQCCLLELTHQAKEAKLLRWGSLFRRQICRIALICGLTGGLRGLISHGENEQQQEEYRKHQYTDFPGTHINSHFRFNAMTPFRTRLCSESHLRVTIDHVYACNAADIVKCSEAKS